MKSAALWDLFPISASVSPTQIRLDFRDGRDARRERWGGWGGGYGQLERMNTDKNRLKMKRLINKPKHQKRSYRGER